MVEFALSLDVCVCSCVSVMYALSLVPAVRLLQREAHLNHLMQKVDPGQNRDIFNSVYNRNTNDI